MSSVSSSGSRSNKSDESVRQVREEYKKKEAALIKKHQQELKAIENKHAQSILANEKSRSVELGHLKAKSQDSLTRKDQKYQNEINNLRKLHTAQLERLMQENKQNIELQKQASRGEVKQAQLGREDRSKELQNKFETAQKISEQDYNRRLAEMRENQKQTIEKTRQKIDAARSKEIEALRDYYTESQLELKNDLRATRNSTQQKLKHQEAQHLADKDRIHQQNITDQREKEIAMQEQLDHYRTGFDQSKKNIAQKYNRELERRDEAVQKNYQTFSEGVKGRTLRREQALEAELNEIKNKLTRTQVDSQRKAREQVKAMQNIYEDKYKSLEEARVETLRKANEDKANTIQQIRAEKDKSIHDNNRSTRMKLQNELFRNRQAFADAEREAQLRSEFQQKATESRVHQIREQAIHQEQRLRENFESNLEMMKEAHQNKAHEQRLQLEKNNSETVQALKTRLQRSEGENRQKLAELTAHYEKRINDLGDQMLKEKRLRDQREKQLISEIKRAHENQLEAVKLRYEEQNRQTVAQHQKELQDVSRRNKQNLDHLMTIAKKS